MKEETKEHLFTIIGSIIIGLIVVLITICLGCAEKHEQKDEIAAINERINSIHNNHIQPLWDGITSNRTLYSNVYKNVLERLNELEKPTEPYDPNAPQYAFLEVAEPNWVAAYGDTLETRIVYNISKNRVMTAMNSKRLLALEDPNEVKQ